LQQAGSSPQHNYEHDCKREMLFLASALDALRNMIRNHVRWSEVLAARLAPHAAFPYNLSLALANFACLPTTARPIAFTSAGLPMGIQIVGPYLEDRIPIHAAELMDDLFGGFVRPPRFEGNAHGN